MSYPKFEVIVRGAACALLSLGLVVAIPSMAGISSQNLDMATQAPGVCRAALGANEAQLRSRPLALQNEGTGTVFVTCAIPQFVSLSDDAMGVHIAFTNMGSSEATVSCTGVIQAMQVYNYVPQSRAVPANTGPETLWYGLAWNDTVDPFPGNYTMISCALPPGVGISRISSFGAAVLTAPAE